MGRLDDLMRHLNPRAVIEKTEIPFDTALAKFSVNSSIVRSYTEFEATLLHFMLFVSDEIYGVPLPPDMALHKAREFLKGDLKQAAFVALSGTDGGVPGIFLQLIEGWKREARQAYLQYVTDCFISPMSFEEAREVMAELKNRLIVFAPQSFAFIEPEAMVGDYKSILWGYVEELKKHKNLWKYW